MLTEEAMEEYNKWKEWISDEGNMFSPNFIPTEDTPQGAVDYYKRMLSFLIDFDDPNFTWPIGVEIMF